MGVDLDLFGDVGFCVEVLVAVLAIFACFQSLFDLLEGCVHAHLEEVCWK